MQNDLTKSELKNKIENLEKYFSKYKKQDVVKKLEEVKEKLNNQEYKIAVVANMSAGKSTFINALFGKKVLPTNNEAVTDSATYIYSKPNIEKKAEIFFADGKQNITVTEDLEREIDLYAYKDERIERIEEEKKENLSKYKNVEKIDLYYPFENLQTSSSEDFSITFIDTPGPNSTGDYGQKHKDQTRSVLNSVDMALFIFDFGQMDALLEDKQGLWHTIKTRCDKDGNFEVYFLINKIDEAMEDNFKDIPAGINNDEFIKQKKESWFKHEEIARRKIIQAAQDHGIKEPKVYLISSFYQLLERNDKKNFDDEDTLDDFKRKHFKRLFENWEEKFIEYLGISNLENDINTYINISVKEKILKIVFDNIGTLKNDELISLTGRIQTLSKPKEEATENVNQALLFLEGDAKKLENNMLSKFQEASNKAIEEVIDLIDSAIQNELYLKIDEMAKIAIAYAEAIAGGENPNNAKKVSKRSFKKINLDKEVSLEIEDSIDMNEVLLEMQSYTKSLFDDYKNNYLDVKSDLKNSFSKYERDISKVFRQVKDNLNSQLKDALDIDIQTIEMQTVDIDSVLSFEVTIPESVLDYKYQEEEYYYKSNTSWWNPFSWFSDDSKIITKEAKHILVINPTDLKKSLEKNMAESVDKFSEKEKENYKVAIVELRRKNSDIFQDFRINKQKEIDELQIAIENSEKELLVVEKQLEDFNTLTKE